MKPKVEKIVLNLGDGKEISLTLEQALELKQLLNNIFGKDIIKEVIIEKDSSYPFNPYKPIWLGKSEATFRDNTLYCNFSKENK